MAFMVEVISKESIKPSSPTPNHLRTLKLSLLDQHVCTNHVCIILFYSASASASDDGKTISGALKRSLSETLTDFYPFAGRISGNEAFNCNDEGLNFFETQVNCPLNVVVSSPVAEELDQLLPSDNFFGLGPKVLISIQANIFDCGGLALGIRISHKIADASTLSLFLTNWAAVARGDSVHITPKFDTSLFPPRHDISCIGRIKSENHVTKMFVFDERNLAVLKAKCSDGLEQATRVQAVLALIWKCAMNVARMRPESASVKAASVANICVNMRGRMIPPLSTDFAGNLAIPAVATAALDTQLELPYVASQLRKGIRKNDAEFMRKLQNNDDRPLVNIADSFKELDKLEVYIFTSWCRFPFYEVDFGWGKPVRASYASLPAKNIVFLMDTICGSGIEAWVCLDKEDMARFECEPDLIAFTSHVLLTV